MSWEKHLLRTAKIWVPPSGEYLARALSWEALIHFYNLQSRCGLSQETAEIVFG